MTPANCCSPCPESEVINTPGLEGDPGTDGTDGSNGANAYTFTTADFLMPAASGLETIQVVSTDWMVVGQPIFIQVAGFMRVNSIIDVNNVEVENVNFENNAAGGTNIPSGSGVSPGGEQPDVSGFAQSGANTDITSLGGLTTPLSVAQGGTGGATAAAARSNLGLNRCPQDFIELEEQQAAGTDAGDFLLGAWRTRDINTEVVDTGGHAALLGAGQFSLSAGTYRVWGCTTGFKVAGFVCRLQNITDATTALVGSAESSAAADNVQTKSFVSGRFTIGGTKTFELQAQSIASQPGNGAGDAANLGVVEVYSILRIEREAG
ncbi:MAG TPA: hypothetical protein VFU31_21055 [Candidatus Binatia bacterium]|nr:hypothetical protein [Candidatus Binatia bacterium]